MKKILLVLLLLIFPITVFAQTGKATYVVENTSGRVLYEENANSKLLVASTVKLMTALLALESNKMNNYVTIDNNIKKAYGAGIGLKVGEKILLKDLMYGLLLRSGNDAALAIALYLGGTEANFAKQMQSRALELNITGATFKNASGLDDISQNYLAAKDLAIIYKEAMKYELFRNIVLTNKYSLGTNMNNYNWDNKNALMGYYKYATGGKTGYTSRSGKVLVSSAKRGQTDITIVTINNGFYKEHLNYYRTYFSAYHTTKLINHEKYRVPRTAYYGNKLKVKQSFLYPVTKEELATVKRELVITKKTKRHGKVGYINIYVNKKLIGKVDVYY